MKTKISILLTVVTFSLISACDKPQNEVEPAVRPVKTLTLGSPNALEKHTFPAVVDAFKKADLSFRVAGKVTKINIKEGDDVKKGDTLAILDESDFEIARSSAKADFTRSKADFDRAKKLVDKGHVSRTDFDKLEASYRIAESNFQAAEKNLEYTVLKAPFSGTVAKRHIENYEDVSAMTPIFSLHDVSRLSIKVNIPESIMIRTNRENTPPRIFAEFENIPNQTFPLFINEISTQADKQSGTYTASLTMDNPDNHNILPGMSATVTGQRDAALAPTGVPGQTFIIPPIAVIENNEGRFVFLAEPADEDRFNVKKRHIKSGLLFESGLEIVSGLARGDRVIIAGVSKMREGLVVKIIEESSL